MKEYKRVLFKYIELDGNVDMIGTSSEPTDWIDGSDWD